MNMSDSQFSFLKRLRAKTHHDPMRDWLALLILSMILLVAIVIWNIWAFDTVAKGGVIGTAPINLHPAFNRSSLDVIHSIFEKRASEETKYENGTYLYADPSQ